MELLTIALFSFHSIEKRIFYFHSDVPISDDDDDDDMSNGRKNQDTLYAEAQGDQIDISDIDTSADIFGK